MTNKLHICEYCDNTFTNKQNLTAHQRRAKYCLKIQGKDKLEEANKYECDLCFTKFTLKHSLQGHFKTCKGNEKLEELTADYNELVKTIENLRKENNIKDTKIIKLESQLESEIKSKNQIIKTIDDQYKEQIELLTSQIDKERDALTDIAKRPTTVQNNNNQRINITQNLIPLDFNSFQGCEENLTIDHHKMGAEGYATFAVEGPLKGKLVCTDKARLMFKYKDELGVIHTDPKLEKTMVSLSNAIKQKSYELGCDHYNDIAKDFTEKEMEKCPTMDYCIALAQYRNVKTSNPFNKELVETIGHRINETVKIK